MSNIIQVSNIAATVTDENIKTLFGFVGSIRETIIYFEDSQQEETKVAYIVYESNSDAETSLHLHNTVFHDRALIVLPLADCCAGQIPDINYAKVIRAPDKTVTGILPKSKSWPRDVISMVVGRTGEQSIITIEPNFIKQGLPTYPKLPYSTEVAKIDEIRRTVLVTNLDSATNAQQVLDFFQPVAEVKFIRMAGSDSDNAAYVEFSEQSAIVKAFGMMGTNLNTRPIMIQHSNVAIVKPSNYLRGLEETSRHVRDSGSVNGRSKSRSRDRKVSKSRKRSRSRRRSRSYKTNKSRRKSKSRSNRRRSKSRSRKRSVSRSRRSPSRSKNRKIRKRSRTRSKDRKRRSRSREKRKERSRSHHRKPKRRSRSKRRDESVGNGKRKNREKSIDDAKEKEKLKDRKRKTTEKHKEERKKKHSSSDHKEKQDKIDPARKEILVKTEKMNGEENVGENAAKSSSQERESNHKKKPNQNCEPSDTENVEKNSEENTAVVHSNNNIDIDIKNEPDV